MIEITPNWHPVFVHFTVALLSVSAGLAVLCLWVREPLRTEWRTVFLWTLWLGAGFMVITGFTGLIASETVAHDEISHQAMMVHRNWAILTMTLFASLAVWSRVSYGDRRFPRAGFLICMVIAASSLASTAWHGGELVYRHGVGVLSFAGSSESHQHVTGHEHEEAEAGSRGEEEARATTDDEKPVSDTDGSGTDDHHDGHDHEH